MSINTVFAEFNYIVEPMETPVEDIEQDENAYFFTYDGEDFFVLKKGYHNPQYRSEYDKKAYDFFKNELLMDGFHKMSDGNYFAVKNSSTYGDYTYADRWKGFTNNHLFVYDKDLNLIADITFDKRITEVFEVNNMYYCNCYYNHIYKSTDKINWEYTYDYVKNPNRNMEFEGNGFRYFPTDNRADNFISLPNSDKTFQTSFETKRLNDSTYNEAQQINLFTRNDFLENKFYFSKNSICFFAVDFSSIVYEEEPGGVKLAPIERWYFTDNYFILESKINLRMKIPREEFEAELNKTAQAPIVLLNDKLLGFTVPPVIEDGRTLVPMRFLFEQMGAKVDWDGETKSATATLNGEKITFGIDNKVATVNDSKMTMDVPARLINDKTMVPLRFLSENLGYTVDWDEDKKLVTIQN